MNTHDLTSLVLAQGVRQEPVEELAGRQHLLVGDHGAGSTPRRDQAFLLKLGQGGTGRLEGPTAECALAMADFFWSW